MDHQDIIVAQAGEIAELRDVVADYRRKVGKYNEVALVILKKIFGIGGPLNDNKLGFTAEQQAVIRSIAELLDSVADYTEDDE